MRMMNTVEFHIMEEPLLYYRIVSSLNVDKRIMATVYCYTAALLYFRKNRGLLNKVFFVRRSLGLLRQMYKLAFCS